MGLRVQGSGCRVYGLGCKVRGVERRVQGSGCRVWGVAFRFSSQGVGFRVSDEKMRD